MSNDLILISFHENSPGQDVFLAMDKIHRLYDSLMDVAGVSYTSYFGSSIQFDLILYEVRSGSRIFGFKFRFDQFNDLDLKDQVDITSKASDVFLKLCTALGTLLVTYGCVMSPDGGKVDPKVFGPEVPAIENQLISQTSANAFMKTINSCGYDKVTIHLPGHDSLVFSDKFLKDSSLIGSIGKAYGRDNYNKFMKVGIIVGHSDLEIEYSDGSNAKAKLLYGDIMDPKVGGIPVAIEWRSKRPLPKFGDSIEVSGTLVDPSEGLKSFNVLGSVDPIFRQVSGVFIVERQTVEE